MFRDFSKACDNLDFVNLINSYSSLSSANNLHSPLGHQVDKK